MACKSPTYDTITTAPASWNPGATEEAVGGKTLEPDFRKPRVAIESPESITMGPEPHHKRPAEAGRSKLSAHAVIEAQDHREVHRRGGSPKTKSRSPKIKPFDDRGDRSGLAKSRRLTTETVRFGSPRHWRAAGRRRLRGTRKILRRQESPKTYSRSPKTKPLEDRGDRSELAEARRLTAETVHVGSPSH